MIRIVRAVSMIGARVRRRRKYRKYRRVRVGLVRVSYEVVLLLMLLRVRNGWRGGRRNKREGGEREKGLKRIGRRE